MEKRLVAVSKLETATNKCIDFFDFVLGNVVKLSID